MILAALLVALAAEAETPDRPPVVERFVAACVNGALTTSGIREIAAADVPRAIRAEFRNRPPGRYYRFDGRSPSYLLVVEDPAPGAEYHKICAIASRTGTPYALFSQVMATLRPETRRAGARPPHAPRDATNHSASMVNHEQGYSIQARRVGGYTLLQSLQFTPKTNAAPAAGGKPE